MNAPARFPPILPPAIVEAQRLALLRRLWAAHEPDGREIARH